LHTKSLNENRTGWAPSAEGKDEIHLWRIRTDVENSVLARLGETLSSDEKKRAESFILAKARHDFTVRRAALREILGFYLAVLPARIGYLYNRFGKPEIMDNKNDFSLKFSVSQTRGEAFCAVAFGREIGVDAESLDRGAANSGIVDSFFTEGEREELRGLSGERQNTAFYRCWTRKESFVKALGEGLSRSLQSFRVSTGAETISRVEFNEKPARGIWNILTFGPTPQTIVSVAFENTVSLIRFFDWHPEAPSYTLTAARTLEFAASDFSRIAPSGR
jgi:4'-phosphopantetheinyl transferase